MLRMARKKVTHTVLRKTYRSRPTEASNCLNSQWQFAGDFEQRIDASLETWQGSDTNAAAEGRSKSSWVPLYPTCPPLKGKIASYSRTLLPIQNHLSVCCYGQKYYVMKTGLVQEIELKKETGSHLFKAGWAKMFTQFMYFWPFFCNLGGLLLGCKLKSRWTHIASVPSKLKNWLLI